MVFDRFTINKNLNGLSLILKDTKIVLPIDYPNSARDIGPLFLPKYLNIWAPHLDLCLFDMNLICWGLPAKGVYPNKR